MRVSLTVNIVSDTRVTFPRLFMPLLRAGRYLAYNSQRIHPFYLTRISDGRAFRAVVSRSLATAAESVLR
jgi:hypothetical protein